MAETEQQISRFRKMTRAARDATFGVLGLTESRRPIVFDLTKDGKEVPAPKNESFRQPIEVDETASTQSVVIEPVVEMEPEQDPVRKISLTTNPVSLVSEVLGVSEDRIHELPSTVISDNTVFLSQSPTQGEISSLTGAPIPGIGVQVQDYIGTRPQGGIDEAVEVVTSRTITAFITEGITTRVRDIGTTGFMSQQDHPIFTFSPVVGTSSEALLRS